MNGEYRDRSYRFLDIWREDDWTLKVYGIHHAARSEGALIDPSIVAAARTHVRARLADANHQGHHHHIGFVVLHQGVTENWLLTLWWAYENVCCHAVSQSALDSPERFTAVDGPVMACVWELVVIDFERRAWVDTMLRGDGGGRSAYLERRLADGSY